MAAGTMRPVGEAVVAPFISPITVMSELFGVTSATTACGSIALFLIRSTISWSTCAGVFPAAGISPA